MNHTKLHTDRNFRPLLLAQLGILALVSTGCALMRKDTAPLPQIPAQQIRLAEGLKLARDGWPEAQWWRRYRDPQLDALMAQALKDAPMMAVARQRVEASRSYASLVDASSGLLIGLTGSMDRQEVSANGYLGPFYHNIPSAGFTGPWYTEGTVGLQAGYDFDFWGKDKARVEAALGLKQARQAEAAQAELVLTSRVAQMYFGMQAIYTTLDLLDQTRTIEAEMVQAHQARAERGLEAGQRRNWRGPERSSSTSRSAPPRAGFQCCGRRSGLWSAQGPTIFPPFTRFRCPPRPARCRPPWAMSSSPGVRTCRPCAGMCRLP